MQSTMGIFDSHKQSFPKRSILNYQAVFSMARLVHYKYIDKNKLTPNFG